MNPAGQSDLQVQQAPSMRAPKRWPLVNNLNSRSNVFTKDARLINAYAEKDRTTGEYQVEKRPGFALTPVIPGGGQGQGIFNALYYSTGHIAQVGPPSFALTQPFTWNYILSIEQDVAFPAGVNSNLFYTVYQGSTLITPKTFLGTVLLNYPGSPTPTHAQFLAIAGTRDVLIGAGAANWTYGINYLGTPN